MPFKQEAMLLHEPIDALGVDGGHTSARRLRFNSAALVDKTADRSGKLDIAMGMT
jgi:hypothetical protein